MLAMRETLVTGYTRGNTSLQGPGARCLTECSRVEVIRCTEFQASCERLSW